MFRLIVILWVELPFLNVWDTYIIALFDNVVFAVLF